jgi:transcriptional regulator with XRE-family HTH domain
MQEHRATDHLADQRRQDLWLSWLYLPWDVVRTRLLAEMRRVGMSQADLAFEMRIAGYRLSQKTVSYWLSGQAVRPPTMDAARVLVDVFAKVAVGQWDSGK